jgi:hypothetical protein
MTTESTPQRLIDALPTTITIDGLEYRVGYAVRVAVTFNLVVTPYESTHVETIDTTVPLEQELQRVAEHATKRMRGKLPYSVTKQAARMAATHRELAAWNGGEKITNLEALRGLFANEQEGWDGEE